jgi:cytochrome c biogenesis protein CcmG/thiol:disulfide interchange protein DsbE
MTRWLAILPLLALIGFAFIGVINLNRAEKPTTSLSDGRNAPPRVFETLIGPNPSYDFSQNTGDTPIAVNLFASWCPPCIVEHPLLLSLEERHPNQVYGILYKDTADKGRAFLERLGNPYTAVAMDPTGKGGLDFGLTGVPETFVISPKGKILLHVRGPLDADTLQEVSDLLRKE